MKRNRRKFLAVLLAGCLLLSAGIIPAVATDELPEKTALLGEKETGIVEDRDSVPQKDLGITVETPSPEPTLESPAAEQTVKESSEIRTVSKAEVSASPIPAASVQPENTLVPTPVLPEGTTVPKPTPVQEAVPGTALRAALPGDADGDGYNDADVAVINAMIDNNGLVAEKDKPETWNFAYWNTASPSEINRLEIAEKGLSGAMDVRGLTSLTDLSCSNNQLTGLNVSGCTALKSLSCYLNQLTSLDLSGLTELTSLLCNNKQLESLNTSGCTSLTELYLTGNYSDFGKLISLDVSGCTALTTLHCGNNQLTSLDVSGCSALNVLSFEDNQLRSLDASGCTSLTELYLDGENNASGSLESLNVSDCTALIKLLCKRNQLTSLDVSGCTALTTLSCSDNQLTNLDVSGCIELTSLYCQNNQLTDLDVSGLTVLTDIYCNDNQLISLNASGCTNLTYLDVSGSSYTSGNLESLNVSDCTALQTLYCNYNQLTSLDMRGCTALENLDCSNNQLNSLNISGYTEMKTLSCYNNQINELDVSDCIALEALSCERNQLIILDASGCTSLTELYLTANYGAFGKLKSLNVSGCTALTTLSCSDNQLTNLDISGCTSLTYLYCANNQISGSLNLGSVKMKYLDFSGNNISRLSMVNPDIEKIDMGGNPLVHFGRTGSSDIRLVTSIEGGGAVLMESGTAENGKLKGVYAAKPDEGYYLKQWVQRYYVLGENGPEYSEKVLSTGNRLAFVSDPNGVYKCIQVDAVFEKGEEPAPTPTPTAAPTANPTPTAEPTPSNKIELSIPRLVKSNYIETGKPIAPQFTDFDAALMTIDVTSAVKPGEYKAIIKLKDTAKYQWKGETNKDGGWEYTWFIIENKPQEKVVDGNTNVTVEGVGGTTFKPGTELAVQEQPKSALPPYQAAAEKIDKNQALVGLFDIKLLLEGQTQQPDGKVKLRLPLTKEQQGMKNLRAVYINDAGIMTLVESSVSGAYLEILTDHFSMYGILADKQEPTPTPTATVMPTAAPTGGPAEKPSGPTTGDTNKEMPLFIILLLSAGAAAGCFVIRKRKAKGKR